MNTQFIVDETGKKTSAILSVEDYEELLADINDLTIIAERKNDPSIRFEDFKKILKSDGYRSVVISQKLEVWNLKYEARKKRVKWFSQRLLVNKTKHDARGKK